MGKDPGEVLEQFVGAQVHEAVADPAAAPGVFRVDLDGKKPGGRRLRAGAAFLSFFLGVSLVLGSLGGVAGRLARERDAGGWRNGDWQETDQFRWTVGGYLEEFLTLGAGGSLNWYDTAVIQEYGYGIAYEEWGGWPLSVGTATTNNGVSSDLASVPNALLKTNPDYYFENDKNVLYRILRQGQSAFVSASWYTNTETAFTAYQDLPEGYNFLLVFEDGKVSIWKDGGEVDVYGDGIYDETSLWFVPGYENFPAGDNVSSTKVYMAVRQLPAQYLQGDYGNGGVTQNNRMYWLYRDVQQSQVFYRNAAAALGAGVALLALAFLLRRSREAADKKIASWTVHIWTELRFLAVTACVAGLLLGDFWYFPEIWYEFLYEGFHPYYFSALLQSLGGCLDNVPALLGLFWIVWLIRNDHRYNPKDGRRSLWNLVSARMGKYPFQTRLTRWNRAAAAAVCLSPVAGVGTALALELPPFHWLFWLLVLIPLAAAVLALLCLRRHAALARDAGLLASQVTAIRDGDLSTPLDLPKDADLRRTAEELNDIQSGMKSALAEQTRSERMKVELISNVSHDLKTPLTSILSYAELLRQEDLSPAAADYARIIDEKAQRLKTMVQDVFDVSKAASDQLPVHLERLDLGKLLRQTLADMAEPIRQSPLTFKTDLPQEPVMIVADGKRLYRVFQNLIQNALQYALEGSRVYLTLTADAGQAEAAVRNTSKTELTGGVDFTARFVRGDESRTDGGSGLGLSIASSFTEACGGAFRVETVADLFTAVVAFPLAEEE